MTPTPAFPPTPTPLSLASTPVYVGPHISLWNFTSSALQVWNTAGAFAVVVQAVILISMVLLGVALFMNWARRFTNEGQE